MNSKQSIEPEFKWMYKLLRKFAFWIKITQTFFHNFLDMWHLNLFNSFIKDIYKGAERKCAGVERMRVGGKIYALWEKLNWKVTWQQLFLVQSLLLSSLGTPKP